MDGLDDAQLVTILGATQTIALVGASHKPQRPSYRVMAFLLAEGYTVFPVNPGLAGSELQGQPVYAELALVPVRVDMVDVFRQSQFLPDITEAAIDHGAKTLWTQLGVMHGQATARARAAGMNVVIDRCPAIELPRLRQLGLV